MVKATKKDKKLERDMELKQIHQKQRQYGIFNSLDFAEYSSNIYVPIPKTIKAIKKNTLDSTSLAKALTLDFGSFAFNQNFPEEARVDFKDIWIQLSQAFTSNEQQERAHNSNIIQNEKPMSVSQIRTVSNIKQPEKSLKYSSKSKQIKKDSKVKEVKKNKKKRRKHNSDSESKKNLKNNQIVRPIQSLQTQGFWNVQMTAESLWGKPFQDQNTNLNAIVSPQRFQMMQAQRAPLILQQQNQIQNLIISKKKESETYTLYFLRENYEDQRLIEQLKTEMLKKFVIGQDSYLDIIPTNNYLIIAAKLTHILSTNDCNSCMFCVGENKTLYSRLFNGTVNVNANIKLSQDTIERIKLI